MANVQPMTVTQKEVFQSWWNGQNLFLYGSAGTGKSFVSLFLCLESLLEDSSPYDKIVIVRSAVPTREIGHLPGDIDEKTSIYEEPYRAIFDELFPFKKSYDNLKKLGKVEFVPSSFLRGTTYNNALIFVDEVQNMTFQELDTVITRVGEYSKIIFSGDMRQTDLGQKKNDVSGFSQFFGLVRKMDEFDCIEFLSSDIVRSGLVKSYIITKENQ